MPLRSDPLRGPLKLQLRAVIHLEQLSRAAKHNSLLFARSPTYIQHGEILTGPVSVIVPILNLALIMTAAVIVSPLRIVWTSDDCVNYSTAASVICEPAITHLLPVGASRPNLRTGTYSELPCSRAIPISESVRSGFPLAATIRLLLLPVKVKSRRRSVREPGAR